MTSALTAASPLLPWLTLAGGLVGGIVVALVNHLFTRRREGSSWLRSEQVAANRNFHEAALTLAHLATHGLLERPVVDAAAEVHLLDRELLAKAQELLVIGETRTVDTALVVSELLPKLAYQTMPLPRTAHPAALKQREDALSSIGELLFDLQMTMRQGMGLGLLAAGGKRTLKRLRADNSFEQQALSPVDREGPKPDLIHLLREWEVLTMAGSVMPETKADYYNGTRVDELPSGGHLLAVLRKPPEGFWLLGICEGIPVEIESKVLQDVARLVTGHMRAFPPEYLHDHKKIGLDGEFPGDTFTWSSTQFSGVDVCSASGGAPHRAGSSRPNRDT